MLRGGGEEDKEVDGMLRGGGEEDKEVDGMLRGGGRGQRGGMACWGEGKRTKRWMAC